MSAVMGGGRERACRRPSACARGQDVSVPTSWEGRAARAVPLWKSPPQLLESRKPSEQAVCANPSHTQKNARASDTCIRKIPVRLSTNPIDHLIHRLCDPSTAYGGLLHETPHGPGVVFCWGVSAQRRSVMNEAKNVMGRSVVGRPAPHPGVSHHRGPTVCDAPVGRWEWGGPLTHSI